jgi:hypothetical protein
MNIDIKELKPITSICGIFVNLDEKLNLKIIDAAINVYMIIPYLYFDKKETNKKEYWLEKLALKMEMVLRNIMLNDKITFNLKDHELAGYLMGKAYLLTGHYPCKEFVKSVITIYKPFLKERKKIYNCK